LLLHGVWIDSDNFSVVFHAEDKMSASTIQKGADALECTAG
jgi:hypothetical protein